MLNAVQGLGIDIVEIERFKKAMEKHPRIIDRLFTKTEQAYCLDRKKPYLHFAVRFAAKEAVLKSLETGRNGIGWKDVEVHRQNNGAPEVKLHNSAVDVTSAKGVQQIVLSLSFSHTNAVAAAIAVGG